MADSNDVLETIKKNIEVFKSDETKLLSTIASYNPDLARKLQGIIENIDSIDFERVASVEQIIFEKALSTLISSKNSLYTYPSQGHYRNSIEQNISDLEKSVLSIKKELDIDKTLLRAKEALDKAQTTTTIEFSDELYKEYEKLENKYFWTGTVWQILAAVSFISILCVLFYHKVELPKAIVDTNGSIGNSFVFSVYALNPVFAKIGLIVFFGAMAGVCLRIYSEYKRLSQEYRQKSLLAKNIFAGHDTLKPYIEDKVYSVFMVPTLSRKC